MRRRAVDPNCAARRLSAAGQHRLSAAAPTPAIRRRPTSGYPPPANNYPPGYTPPPGLRAAPGYAPPGYMPPPSPTANQHEGFYLRLHFGGGFGSMGDAAAQFAFVGGGYSFGYRDSVGR